MSYTPPRPFTHDLMLSVMEKGGLVPVKGVIYEVKDGIYSSFYLYAVRMKQYFSRCSYDRCYLSFSQKKVSSVCL